MPPGMKSRDFVKQRTFRARPGEWMTFNHSVTYEVSQYDYYQWVGLEPAVSGWGWNLQSVGGAELSVIAVSVL